MLRTQCAVKSYVNNENEFFHDANVILGQWYLFLIVHWSMAAAHWSAFRPVAFYTTLWQNVFHKNQFPPFRERIGGEGVERTEQDFSWKPWLAPARSPLSPCRVMEVEKRALNGLLGVKKGLGWGSLGLTDFFYEFSWSEREGWFAPVEIHFSLWIQAEIKKQYQQ